MLLNWYCQLYVQQTVPVIYRYRVCNLRLASKCMPIWALRARARCTYLILAHPSTYACNFYACSCAQTLTNAMIRYNNAVPSIHAAHAVDASRAAVRTRRRAGVVDRVLEYFSAVLLVVSIAMECEPCYVRSARA